MKGLEITAAMFYISIICMLVALPLIYACGSCQSPHPNYPRPNPAKPPHHRGRPRLSPPSFNPPAIIPPPSSVPGIFPPPATPTPPKCPINTLKLGACVDVLGGLIHIGLGNPIENSCCPIIQGLLEVEAAICLCTAISLKLLNLNIFIPLALEVLITCGLTPPPGFVCPNL